MVVTLVEVDDEVVADDADDDPDTAAGAELELSPRATSNAAPTTPIATAVPTDMPPDAEPALPCCAFTLVIGDNANKHDTTAANNLFFIMFNLMFIYSFAVLLNTIIVSIY